MLLQLLLPYLVVLVLALNRSESPWTDVIGGLGLMACGIFAGLPLWRGSKKHLGISLGVAGAVLGLGIMIALN